MGTESISGMGMGYVGPEATLTEHRSYKALKQRRKTLDFTFSPKGRYYQLRKAIVSFMFTDIKGRCRVQDLKKKKETQAAKRSQRWSRENRLWIA